ncbi:hypothetical protein ACFFIX_12885 [Metabacillus herbersteinensis]|uniref:Uncharacterized protein n=1 Tax=Metabacillus herbersteinensis TaxID=283816 RepID=A0ABV6GF82_9BACI
MMNEFKLKNLYIKRQTNQLYIREGREWSKPEESVILRVGEQKAGTSNFHHFRVPKNSTVDVLYETIDKLDMVRIQFNLMDRSLSLQFFSYDEESLHYIEAPLDPEIVQSQSFQVILQSISFSSNHHFSYLVNSSRKLRDLQT